jgi:valyl-tRNA synthetase
MLNMFDADANVVQVADGLSRRATLACTASSATARAREVVVAEMKTLGLLVLHPGKADAEGNVPMLEAEARTIQTPFGDRGGVVIEPWLTDQWYVNAAELAKAPIEAVKTGAIEIVPKSWEKTYFNWMDNIQPWCVSRQLWWGHQIPAWYGPSRNDELGTFRSQRGLGSVACERGETLSRGMKVRRSKQQHCSTPNCNHERHFTSICRDPDVLDTWFSSALWPFATLGWPDQTPEMVARHYPNDLLISGFDILFFWCARMAMQDAFHGRCSVEASLSAWSGARLGRAEDVQVQGQCRRSAGPDRQIWR